MCKRVYKNAQRREELERQLQLSKEISKLNCKIGCTKFQRWFEHYAQYIIPLVIWFFVAAVGVHIFIMWATYMTEVLKNGV